jgi:carboxyl-terminal processing protease
MKLSLKKIRLIILVVALVIAAGGSGYWLGQKRVTVGLSGYKPEIKIERQLPVGKENLDFSLFWEVWDRLEESYLDKEAIDYSKMIEGAISGMVASLGDPYTVFLPPEENQKSKDDLAGSFEGVGMQLGYKDSQVVVVAPLKGTPAEEAGVKAGDIIVHVKDEATGVDEEIDSRPLTEVVNMIRGDKGTPVTITFMREGVEKPLDITIIRGTILIPSVEVDFKDAKVSDKKIAHLTLTRFGDRTDQEWQAAITQILQKKTNGELVGVVLDLRNNPGGYLQGAVYIASEFLSQGVVVQQEEAIGDGKETFSVNRQGRLTDVPLVVLVNQGSASASEIVAGALQERERAKLVGEQTFGKGTIQEAEDLSAGSGLHITIARWLLPSGKNIDKEGLTPDYEVAMDETDQSKDPQLDKALEILTK